MSDRVEVASVEELRPGERVVANVSGRSVGVFNVDGEYYAIQNECLHEGGPVCEGKVHGALIGEFRGPGERVYEEFSDTPAVACPWHGWEYDITTGDHLGDSEVSLRTFDVEVDDGTIYVVV